MKRIFIIFFTFLVGIANAQTKKVAILDFENTSGKTEFDGLGKTLSNMLITDLKNNIDPKKVEFYERGQLNKLLDEQNLQKSKDFDKKTAVDFGKLSGVHYVFVGSLFVLDGSCNISSRLIDVQTSKIVLSKDVSGKIEEWLSLTSELAESISMEINNPIYFEKNHKKATSEIVLKTYAKGIIAYDKRNFDEAKAKFKQVLLIDENFTYAQYDLDKIIDLKKKNEKLKKIEEIVHFEKIFYNTKNWTGVREIILIEKYYVALVKLSDLCGLVVNPNIEDIEESSIYELGLEMEDLNTDRLIALFKERVNIYVKARYWKLNRSFNDRKKLMTKLSNIHMIELSLNLLIPFEYGTLKENNLSLEEINLDPNSTVKASELFSYTLNLVMKFDEMMDENDMAKFRTIEFLDELKILKIQYKI